MNEKWKKKATRVRVATKKWSGKGGEKRYLCEKSITTLPSLNRRGSTRIKLREGETTTEENLLKGQIGPPRKTVQVQEVKNSHNTEEDEKNSRNRRGEGNRS